MTDAASKPIPSFASALSVRSDSVGAVREIIERAEHRMQGTTPDFGFLFLTPDHIPQAPSIVQAICERTGVRSLISVSARGVIGSGLEIEGAPGLSLLLGSIPGVQARPFRLQDLPKVPKHPSEEWGPEVLRPAIKAGDRSEENLAAIFLFPDPYSMPLVRLLPAISDEAREAPVIGGLASAGQAPGQNILGINEHLSNSGGVGLSLIGHTSVTGVVSQGCKPIGPTLVVTKARGNVLLELAGKKAADVVRDVIQSLNDSQRKQLKQGLLIGRVINEYKDHFGQGDFLIRSITGFDQNHGALLTDDFFKVGQTIKLHVRDAATSDSDLTMLLDAQKLNDTPSAGLVFSCTGRGRALFREPNHDVNAINRAFSPEPAGEQRAKSGEQIDVARPTIPLAGFFSAGEIGPIGGKSLLHTYTASLAFFRNARPGF